MRNLTVEIFFLRKSDNWD